MTTRDSGLEFRVEMDPAAYDALFELLTGVPPAEFRPRYDVTVRRCVVLPVHREPPGQRWPCERRVRHAARRRTYALLRRRDRRRGHGPRAWRQRTTHIPAAVVVPAIPGRHPEETW